RPAAADADVPQKRQGGNHHRRRRRQHESLRDEPSSLSCKNLQREKQKRTHVASFFTYSHGHSSRAVASIHFAPSIRVQQKHIVHVSHAIRHFHSRRTKWHAGNR